MFAVACLFLNHAKYVLLLVTLTQSKTVKCALMGKGIKNMKRGLCNVHM
jgi:hypothetical protein